MVAVSRVLFLLLILFLKTTVPVYAEDVPVIEFDSNSTRIDLTPYIQILPDPDRNFRLFDVVNEKQDEFRSVSEIGNSFGFSKSAYWISFTLRMSGDLQNAPFLQLEYPFFDNVTLFIPDGAGGYNQKITGDSLPFAERDVKHRTFLFHLTKHQSEIRRYYMRVQTSGSTQIAMSLLKTETLIEDVDGNNLLLGVYYGIFLLLLAAAFVSYSKVRDIIFLYYGFYLLSYLLFQFSLNGYSYQYLWPEMPWFQSRATAYFCWPCCCVWGAFFRKFFTGVGWSAFQS